MQRVTEILKEKEVVVLPISIDGGGARAVKPYMEKHEYTFDTLIDQRMEVARQGTPGQHLIIDHLAGGTMSTGQTGFDDVTWAFPLDPGHLAHVRRLAGLHHCRNARQVFFIRDLNGLDIDVRVLGFERGHHRLDRRFLHIGTPVSEPEPDNLWDSCRLLLAGDKKQDERQEHKGKGEQTERRDRKDRSHQAGDHGQNWRNRYGQHQQDYA